MNCYIYFKALTSNEAQVIAQVANLQIALKATLQAAPDASTAGASIVSELQRRPQAKYGMHTWMEIYRDVPDDFADRMSSALNSSNLSSVIDGERHMEFFIPVRVCA